MKVNVVHDFGPEVILEVNDALLQLFRDYRVFFTAEGQDRLRVGEHIAVMKATEIEPYTGILIGNSIPKMGAYSYSWSDLNSSFKIGRYCSVASGLRLLGVRHPIEALTTNPVCYDANFAPVAKALQDHKSELHSDIKLKQAVVPVVGNDVWIGTNVTLASGIRIGDGAVVAAESVVTKDVPAYTIVGGNPAKFIRYRFEEEVRVRLICSQWWKYNFIDLQELQLSNPVDFLDNFDRKKSELQYWKPQSLNLWNAIQHIA